MESHISVATAIWIAFGSGAVFYFVSNGTFIPKVIRRYIITGVAFLVDKELNLKKSRTFYTRK